MNPFHLPYHLLLPSLLSFMLLLVLFLKRKQLNRTGRRGLLWTALFLFLSVYFVNVSYATYDLIYSKMELQEFDLNGDGIFTGNEINPEQKKALSNVATDTSRNFSFIFGAVKAGFIAGFYLSIGLILQFFRKSN
ncbi:MAG: hypothetical protein P1U56_12560 [Saprospiraceae bacterium]|nr:hypothetical protein [Saprospiraceae bacterium]